MLQDTLRLHLFLEVGQRLFYLVNQNQANIAFSNFTGTAVRAQSLSGLAISGINVFNSGTGINLTSVTDSLVGGTGVGQGNTLTNCSREGIYATGVCLNTQLVKNSFPGTTAKYNLASSRGITVVN